MEFNATFYVNGEKFKSYKAVKTILFKNVTKDDVISLKFEHEVNVDEWWLSVYVLDLTSKEYYSRNFTKPYEEFDFKFYPTVYGHDVEVYISLNSILVKDFLSM